MSEQKTGNSDGDVCGRERREEESAWEEGRAFYLWEGLRTQAGRGTQGEGEVECSMREFLALRSPSLLRGCLVMR